MDCPVFDPRREEYKKPYGAVSCGTVLTVTVRPLHTEDFVAAAVIFQEEFAGTVREIPLTVAGAAEDRDLFTGSFPAPEEPELGWYRFRFRRRDGGIRWMGKNGYGGEEVTSWQQTVYDGSRPTPGWFGEGVTYQIFPDRFRRTFIPDPRGMLGDRWVHQGWEEPMVYLPDGNGEIRNRDFFGGNLQGVEEKLDYLYSLGVTTLYFCPIFESDSNHRYNTGDYDKVDPNAGGSGGFGAAVPQGRGAGDACDAGRSVQPYRQQQPLLQRPRHLSLPGGGPEPGEPLLPLVQFPGVALAV